MLSMMDITWRMEYTAKGRCDSEVYAMLFGKEVRIISVRTDQFRPQRGRSTHIAFYLQEVGKARVASAHPVKGVYGKLESSQHAQSSLEQALSSLRLSIHRKV